MLRELDRLTAVTGLVAAALIMAPTGAACASFTSQEVTFASEGLGLVGTLLAPDGDGPFPAAVLVHGSGGSSRSNPWTTAYAEALASRGVVILHPDKRGAGESEGDWRQASFESLARDALAALERLRQEPKVDVERAGLIGFSQGGDIVPLAATMSTSVKFVVDVSGSVVPLVEQIGDEIRLAGIEEGLDHAQLEALQHIHRLGWSYVLEGGKWADYHDELARASSGVLAGSAVVAGFPTEQSAPAWGFLRAVGNFDPLPYWHRLEVPGAFLFGRQDSNVDVPKSVAIIEQSLMGTGASKVLMVFGNNGHAHIRDDALDFLVRWIRDGGVD